MATATSHARGTAGHSPAQFKEVAAAALGSDEALEAWSARVVATAASYRQQVLLDFHCFKDWHDTNFSHSPHK